MIEFCKPRICVSRCLGFEACRYNGQMQNNSFINNLSKEIDIVTVCPESDIGLGIPRENLRIVKNDKCDRLVQPKLGLDITDMMVEFSEEFINNLGDIDGFILKTRSPSCGIKDVKIYSGTQKGASCEKGQGFFSRAILKKYPSYLVEDEGRLSNYKIRQLFLTKIYTKAAFRKIKETNDVNELSEFHSKNKMLFSAYNKSAFIILNKILKDNNSFNNKEKLFYNYEKNLEYVFSKNARYTSNVKVLRETIEKFKPLISKDEIKFLDETVAKYEDDKIPLNTCVYLVKSYAIRFKMKNTLEQSFFTPYPEHLIELSDSGKGRND